MKNLSEYDQNVMKHDILYYQLLSILFEKEPENGKTTNNDLLNFSEWKNYLGETLAIKKILIERNVK